jgi:hypothetical protein
VGCVVWSMGWDVIQPGCTISHKCFELANENLQHSEYYG